MTTPEQIARETAEKKHVSMCFDCTRKLGFEKLWNDANTGTMGGTIGCELCGKSNWLRDIAIPAIERAIGGEEPKPTPTAEHITNEIVNTFNPWFLTRDDAKLLHKLILNALTQSQSRIAELESILERKGYRKSCDIPACNCGDTWNHGGHAEDRLREIADEVWENGVTTLDSIKRLKSQLDAAKEAKP